MISRALTFLIISVAFTLGFLFSRPSEASQNVTLNILPPTGSWGQNANLTSGYGHCCATVSDATGADWSNGTTAHPTYLRAIGVSSDTSTKKRAIYRVVDGPSYIGCNFTTWVDIYNAQTGVWLFSIGHLHTVNGIYRTGGLSFRNTGSSSGQTAIQVATTTTQQDCDNTGHHVHETSPWGTMAGSIVLNSKFDVGEEGAYLNSDINNFSRKLTWTINPNSNQNHRLVVWHSQKCLRPESSANDSRIIQYDCNDTSAQQVGVIDELNGYFAVVFLSSGRCMEVLFWQTYGNAPIGIHDCNGSSNQQWSGPFDWGFLLPHYNRFVSEYYGGPYNGPAWLALEGESQLNGAFLNQWWWSDRPNQYYIHY